MLLAPALQAAKRDYVFESPLISGSFEYDEATPVALAGELDQFTAYDATSLEITYNDGVNVFTWTLDDLDPPNGANWAFRPTIDAFGTWLTGYISEAPVSWTAANLVNAAGARLELQSSINNAASPSRWASTVVRVFAPDTSELLVPTNYSTVAASKLVEMRWEARVTNINVPGGSTAFAGVNVGSVISGSYIYDIETLGTITGTGATEYSNAIVSATAQVGPDLLAAGSSLYNFIGVTDDLQGFPDQYNWLLASSFTETDGALNGSPASVLVQAIFRDPESSDVISSTAIPVSAPALGRFGADSEIVLWLQTPSGTAQLTAALNAVQSFTYRNEDRDGDGISDAVELALDPPLDPDNPADASGDLDGDGFNNRREVLAGSKADDSGSIPRPGFFRIDVDSIQVDEGDGFIPVDVSRHGGDNGAVYVQFSTDVGTLEPGVDYQPVVQNLFWADGQSGPQRVLVPIFDNPDINPSKMLRFRLSNNSPGTEISDGDGFAGIADDDIPEQGIPFGGYLDHVYFYGRRMESDRSIEVLFNRRGSTNGRVSLEYSTNILGWPAEDWADAIANRHANVTGSVVWEDGDASVKTVRIPIYDDLSAENEPQLYIVNSGFTGDAFAGYAGTSFVIEDEEFLLQDDTVGFAVRGNRFLETEAVLRVPLRRLGENPSAPVTVEIDVSPPINTYAIDGHAEPGVDYDASQFPTTVSWGAGESGIKEVVVPLIDDTGLDVLEIVPLTISGNTVLPPGTVQGRSTSINRIFDYEDIDSDLDTDGDGIPDIADLDPDGDGVAGALDAFPLDASENSDLDGDGIGDNSDTDLDGDGVGNAIEDLLGRNPADNSDIDADTDGDQSSDALEVAAGSNPQNAASQPGPGYVEIASLNNLVSEDGRALVIELHRVLGSSGPLSVLLSTQDQTAVAGIDYQSVAEIVSWADGDTGRKQVVIPVLDNDQVDGYRTIGIFMSPQGGTTQDRLLGSQTLALILDDDFDANGVAFAGLATTSSAILKVRESAGFVQVRVDRRGSRSGTFKVDYVLEQGSAGAGFDYVDRSGTLTWLDGSSEPQTITIPIVDDLLPEGSTVFYLQLEAQSNAGFAEFEETQIIIVDDELAGFPDVILAADIEPGLLEEDGTTSSEVPTEVELIRIGDGSGAVTIDLGFVDLIDEAELGVDYIGDPGGAQLSWANGETGSKFLPIPIIKDAEFEDFEGFQLVVSSVPVGVVVDSYLIEPFIADPEDLDLFSDSDGDGIVDFADLDDDNDNFFDFADEFPNDPTRIGDSDGDGVDDLNDDYPDDPNASSSDVVSITSGQKLFGSDTSTDDRFGWAMDAAEGLLAVGAIENNATGTVYVFSEDANGNWFQSADLFADDAAAGDHYGRSVAVTPTNILVGAPLKVEPAGATGAAYIYGFDPDDGWIADAKLTPSDGETDDLFGLNVAMDGNIAVIGAMYDDDLGTNAGAVYVFEKINGNWTERAKLTASDGAAGALFGRSVAIDGDVLVVGAVSDTVNGIQTGAVYPFFRDITGIWYPQTKITPDDGEEDAFFGRSVALDDGTLLVGAPGTESYRGSAYVYYGPFGNFVFQQRLQAVDGRADDVYGTDVRLDNGIAVVGAYLDDSPIVDAGSAYVYAYNGAQWDLQDKLVAADAGLDDYFGFSVAVAGDIFIGAPSDDDAGSQAGAAYVFDVAAIDRDGDGIGDATDADDDGDGIPDGIERDVDGLNETNPNDAEGDLDGDGVSNLREAKAGTRIDDADSTPGAGYVSLVYRAYTADESDVAVPVEVRRMFGDVGAVSVTVETVDGSGKAFIDYQPVTQTLNWADGDSSPQFVNIPLIDNTEAQPSRIFTVELSNPAGGVEIFDDQTYLLIANDEIGDLPPGFAGEVRVSSAFGLVTEASGQMTLWIDRDLSSTGPASVDYEVSQFLQPGFNADLIASTGTISWADGEEQPQAVVVQLIDDGELEPTDQFQLILSNPSVGVDLVAASSWSGQIFDEDSLRGGSYSGPVNQFTGTEEESGELALRLFRLGDGAGALQLDPFFLGPESIGNSQQVATAGVDYDNTPQSAAWLDGEVGVKELTIPVFDDSIRENEFILSFLPSAQSTNVSVAIVYDFADTDLTTDTDGDGVVDGLDYDADDDGVANQGDLFPLDATESMDTDGDGVGNNADSDDDGDGIGDRRELELGLDPLNFEDAYGDQDGDGVLDRDEIQAGSDPLNDQSVPGTGFIEIGTTNVYVSEDAGNAVITVNRIRGNQGEMSVLVTTSDATAVAGVDYGSVTRQLTWGDGDSFPRQVFVPISDNSTADGLRSFNVELTAFGTPDNLITVNSTVVLILEDDIDAQGTDFAGYFDVAANDLRVPESQNTFAVQVFRRGSSNGAVSVDYSIVGGTATEGEDYTNVSGTLNWTDGDSAPKTVQVPIIDDNLIESTEVLRFQLANPTKGAGLGFGASILTIVDEEIVQAPSAIGFAQLQGSVRETDGDQAVVSLLRLGTPDGDISVDLDYFDYQAFRDVDFVAAPQTITFAQGEIGRKDVIIGLIDDSTFELEFMQFVISPTVPGPFVDNGGIGNALIYDEEDEDKTADFDADQVPDIVDGDADNDNVANTRDQFPFDSTRAGDSDGDGVDDLDDAFPDDPNLSSDAIVTVTELDKLRASDGVAGDFFGSSVAIDGDVAFVGAPGAVTGGFDYAGSVYVFVRRDAGVCPVTGSADSWCEVQKLTASDPGEFALFGRVSLQGDTAVVTASGGDGTGSAYVFERNQAGVNCAVATPVGDWCQTVKLAPQALGIGDQFGLREAALSGNTIAIGAELHDAAALDAGAVFVFERNVDSDVCAATGSVDAWCESRVTAADAAEDDRFGHSLALDGDTLLVSADRDDDNGDRSGSAYVFTRNFAQTTCPQTGTVDDWCQISKLTASDGMVGDLFGRRLALVGDTAVIGAPIVGNVGGLFSSGRGAAYVFENPGNDSWVERDKLEPRGGAGYGDIFGYAAFDGATMVIGSPSDDVGAPNTGSAFVYSDTGAGNWQQQAKLVASDAAEGDLFGDESSAVAGNTIMVGAAGDDDLGADSGSVYVFALGPVDSDSDDLVDTVDWDDDNDGIDDLIENQYDFLNRVNPNDAALDFDGDGISNLREVRAGYRPDDADSVPDAGYLSFGAAFYSWEESDGSVPIVVHRLRGDAGAVSVTVETVDGSAVAGEDYVATTQTLSWADGETGSQQVNVPLIDNPEFGGGIFAVRLTPVSTERVLVDETRVLTRESRLEFTGIDFLGNLLAGTDETRFPESAGFGVVYVQRQGTSAGAISVDYDLVPVGGAPATPGEDYLDQSGTLSWADGDSSPKPVFIRVLDDALIETTESLQLVLSNASGSAPISPFSQYIHIVDNEIVQLTGAVGPVSFLSYLEEPDAGARLRFLRTGDGAGQVSVGLDFPVTAGAATPGVDFEAVPQNVTWLDGETGIREILVPIIDDAQVDSADLFESIAVSITGVGGATYSEWYGPAPIVFDLEDLDITTDSDGDGTPNVWDLDDDNDLIPDSQDPNPLGTPAGTPLQDLFLVEDGNPQSVNLALAFEPAATLDQFQLDGTQQNQAVRLDRSVGQSMTIGTAGTLEAIELALFVQGSGEPLIVEILDFSGGNFTTAPLLGSVAIAEGQVGSAPGSLSLSSEAGTVIDLSALNIAVDVGDQIALRLRSDRPLPALFAVQISMVDVYPGGTFFENELPVAGLDAAFKLSVREPAEPLSYAVVSNSNPALFETLSITGSQLDLQTALHQSGSAEISIQASSVSGDVSTDSFSVIVGAAVDTPQLSVSPQSGLAGLPIPLNINATLVDLDGSETLSVVVEPVPPQYLLSAGVESPAGSSSWTIPGVEAAGVALLPQAPFSGSFDLFVTATATELSTGDTASANASFVVTVQDTGDVDPIAVDDDLGSVLIGSTTSGFNALANDSNLSNTPLTVSIASPASLGLAVVGAGNTLSYTAPDDAAGEDNFSYTVTDADGDSSTAVVSVFVNDVPLAVNDEVETLPDTPVDFDVLGNDSGLLNGLAGVNIVTAPASGSLLVNPDNTLRYVPAAGVAGNFFAIYSIEDTDGDIATANISILVDALPQAIADDAGETVIGTPILAINVIDNDLGLENGPITVEIELAPNALVTVNDDNTLNYLPNAGFSGPDAFLYRILDADGDTSVAQVNTLVTSASGIPGANANLVGPTPDDPLYVPDTGLRQQNEVQCAFQSDNLLRIMCVYNDWRAVELNGDGSIGVSMTRDQTSWFSRLAPNHNQYEETLGLSPSADIDQDLGFSADPVIASVPGGMLTGSISSFRDERRGTGGLYMQRWYEQNSEIGFPFQPQRELITVATGEPGRFLDKDHMIFNINQSTPEDTVTVNGTLENGENVSREWPAGEVTFIYSEFYGSDGELVDFEDLTPGIAGTDSGLIISGDQDNVQITQAPLVDTLSLLIDTAGLSEPTSVTFPDVLPQAAARGTQIALQFLLFAPDVTAAGSFNVSTPYGSFVLGNGVVSVGSETQPFTASVFQVVTLFADPISSRFNLAVGEAVFNDIAFDTPVTSDVTITATDAGSLQLYIEAIGFSVATDSDILVTQSSDFGENWSDPVALTPAAEGTAAHQGAYLAARGNQLLAVWRRIDDELNADPVQSDAIMYALSNDRGQSWSASAPLRDNICPFDQSSQKDRFRTRTFPVAVGTSDGFQVFWSDRDYAGGFCETGPARVVMSMLGSDGVWTTPQVIDPVTREPQRFGHQFMPAANVSQDQVQVAWYDSRNDESRSYTDQLNDAAGESEGTVLLRRHTLDVRSVRIINGTPVDGSIQVTQFQQGVSVDAPDELIQLERFYANGRIFQQGLTPFLGDYIGVATRAHRFNGVTGTWESNATFNPVSGEEPLFFVSWADNRDVRGDVWKDLDEPTAYTPGQVPMAASTDEDSETEIALNTTGEQPAVLVEAAVDSADALDIQIGQAAEEFAIDETDVSPAPVDALEDTAENSGMCVPGSAESEFLGLTRNQNVYGSMIRPGFQLSVPTPSKPIDEFQRGYVLYLQNFTSQPRSYTVEILNQPEDGRASFRQVEADTDEPLTLIPVVLTPRSSTARTVFITSTATNPTADLDQRVTIQVFEVACTTDCQQQQVTLNGSNLGGEFDNPGLQFPGLQFGALEAEVRAPVIASPIVTPGLQFPGLQFPGLQFPGLQFPGLQFPGLQFPGLQFPGLQFPGLQFPGLQFPGLQFPGLQFDPESDDPRPVSFNQTVEVPEGGTRDPVENAALVGRIEGLEMTQIVWPVTNEGNVIGSFDLEPFVNADITGLPSQILVVRSYVQNTLINCALVPLVRQEVIVNVADPDLDGEDSGINVFIAPGETLMVVLRVWQPLQEPGSPPPPDFSVVDADNSAIAVMADACDSNTLDVCDPESEDPAAMPPTATVGEHPVAASFEPVAAGSLSITSSRLRTDRATRQAYSDITVTNNTANPIIGKVRVVLNANKPPLNADGMTSETIPRPYLQITPKTNSVMSAGQSVTVRVFFDGRRPAPSFSTELQRKSVSPL